MACGKFEFFVNFFSQLLGNSTLYNRITLVLHCQVSCYDLFFFYFSYFSFIWVVPAYAIVVGSYEKRYVGELGCSVTTPRYHLYVLSSSSHKQAICLSTRPSWSVQCWAYESNFLMSSTLKAAAWNPST